MKTWETPKLIALVRTNPQEAVLTICKGNGSAMAAAIVPDSTYDSCRQFPDTLTPTPCNFCSSLSAS